ncbi:MAG: hypothetical protein V7L23_05685 [Nostoc sp.]|uniref:hypothetical protein n=1 Tax=Nostoc sp. TaxID=1180 RepID=UPI002FF08FEE
MTVFLDCWNNGKFIASHLLKCDRHIHLNLLMQCVPPAYPGFLTNAQSLCLCRGAGEQGSRGAEEQRSRGAGEQRSRGEFNVPCSFPSAPLPLCPSAPLHFKLVRNAGYIHSGLSHSLVFLCRLT